MELKKCIFTHSGCYLAGVKMTGNKPLGIVVHSTGANNKTLKRYVQPIKGDANYDEVIADIGKNAYNNHWNKSGKKACVHAFIGVNASNKVETYQVLPWDYCCWGCGKGKYGSYNYNPTPYIQFEICEDNLKDEAYFNVVMKEAQELCAYLCKQYSLTELHICSHAEAYKKGYATNHGDIDHWLKKFGKNMDWFRDEVKKILKGEAKPAEPPKAIAVGDVVEFIGNTHYYSANSKTGKSCKSGKAKVLKIYQLGKSRHPYQLKATSGGGSTVYGWVDVKDIKNT